MSEQKTKERNQEEIKKQVQHAVQPPKKSLLSANDHAYAPSQHAGESTGRTVNKQFPHQANDHSELNNCSSRNKVSVNLPCLSNHTNYGDRIFDKQSASTLQKTILVYSIPKAHRFNSDPKYNGEPAYCIDTCFKPHPFKGAGFGFGRKKQYPDWMERNMKENPPPGAYFENLMEVKRKGRTFGIAHKYYEKVLIPKEKQNSFQVGRSQE